MPETRLTYGHVILYSVSGGRIDPSNDQAGFLKLTTIGRKSGQKRTVHLLYLKAGDSYVITASNAGRSRHPGWFFNLRDNPDVTIQVKGRQEKAVAEIAGPEKKRELWARLVKIAHMYEGYEKRSSREIPMVILHPSYQ